jgi:hypothetical protein
MIRFCQVPGQRLVLRSVGHGELVVYKKPNGGLRRSCVIHIRAGKCLKMPDSVL